MEMEVFTIFDPSIVPSSSTELNTYGNEELALLGENMLLVMMQIFKWKI